MARSGRTSKISKATVAKPKRVARSSRAKVRGKPVPAFDPAADLAERVKIGEMFDVEALAEFHQSNTATNTKYWQTPDHSGD